MVQTERTIFFSFQQSILLYWVTHGVLSAVDSICSESSGYFFGKLILLGTIFAHAVNQNPDVRYS